MLRCHVFGHRLRFGAEGQTMEWACERCGGEAGSKEYADAATAQRYALAFDREDRSDVGRRAPLLGMIPLRIWRRMRERMETRS